MVVCAGWALLPDRRFHFQTRLTASARREKTKKRRISSKVGRNHGIIQKRVQLKN